MPTTLNLPRGLLWALALLFATFIAGAPLLAIEPVIHPALRGFTLFYKILCNGMVPALFYALLWWSPAVSRSWKLEARV